jgi:glucose-1-phosphate adenylyltransferase
VPAAEAHLYGIVETDGEQRVTRFLEKPLPVAGRAGTLPASMGLYVFRTEVLVRAVVADAAREDSTHDFGRDILPRTMEDGRLFAYDFSTNAVPGMTEAERGYWRDVGSIDAYWRASQDLVSVSPAFSLYNPDWPIYSAYYPSPPAKFVFADLEHDRVGIATDSMVSEGCIISGGRVDRSILGPRVRVNSFAAVTESILFDGVEVGRHARVHRAILDKNVIVPPGTSVGVDADADRRRFTVSEGGIVVVPKGTDLGAS